MVVRITCGVQIEIILIGQILIIIVSTTSPPLSLQLSCWSSSYMLWWELPGLSSIISHALMSLPKIWLWVRERGYKGEWEILIYNAFDMLESE